MSLIRLYQLPRSWNIPNASCFCCKVETYLRMSGLTFEIKSSYPFAAPLRKLPYISDDGRVISDSRLIIEHLERKTPIPLGCDLDSEQKAVAISIQRLIEEHLYWVSLYSRCCDSSENWRETKLGIVGALPPVVRDAVALIYRRRFRREIFQQGLGRLPRDEVYKLGMQDIDALANWLGDKTYMMGNNPTPLDASTFGILINILEVPIESPLKTHALRYENLVAYCSRIKGQYFSDLVPSNGDMSR